jgi:hypothetical protein
MNENKSLIPPCKECTGRVMMCHDTCDRYKQFKQNKENVKTARAEFLSERSIVVESANRQRKRRNSIGKFHRY